MAEFYSPIDSPWMAAKYLRQVCQYCNTKNVMEANNCTGCGAPLREAFSQPESVKVEPLPAALLYYVRDGYDLRACLKMNGELRAFNVNTSKFLGEPNSYERSRIMIREMAIAFKLPLEFFDPSKWHSENNLGLQCWVRDADIIQ